MRINAGHLVFGDRMHEPPSILRMRRGGLGKSFTCRVGNEKFLARDANTFPPVFLINFRRMGLKPCGVAIELFPLRTGFLQFDRIRDFFHHDVGCSVRHIVLSRFQGFSFQ